MVSKKAPLTLSLSKGRSWFDKLTTNGSIGLLDTLLLKAGLRPSLPYTNRHIDDNWGSFRLVYMP